MNIKNIDVETNIRKLAARTGESLTDAVNAAVREKLARLDEQDLGDGPAQTVEAFLAAVRPLQDEAETHRRIHRDKRGFAEFMKEFDEEFYDEDGLPR